jgi:hypothetical protein
VRSRCHVNGKRLSVSALSIDNLLLIPLQIPTPFLLRSKISGCGGLLHTKPAVQRLNFKSKSTLRPHLLHPNFKELAHSAMLKDENVFYTISRP